VRQQECVGVQKDFAGLKYEYVSTEKGMNESAKLLHAEEK